MIGRTLGHYRIVEKLGEGGMGVVYKAQDLHLDRLVALKILPPDKFADPARKQRFTQEAKAASALNHPNIVTIHDIDQADGVDFIAMEYVEGKTLDEVIPRHGMRLNEALKCAVQMADALAKAHAAGIIHRDLKPGNVMVTGEGQVKVLDFGLAKLTEAALLGDDEPTRTAKPTTDEGTILGTVAYMSPEQAQGKKVDVRSDIFSFGAVLYEVVTGSRAFQGDTRASTLAAVLKDEPKPPSQIAVGLPRDVERLIRRCLQKDPAHRVQHMDDLKVALEELKAESDSGALAAAAAPTQTRRGRWWLPVAVACTVLLAALVAWLWRRPAEPPRGDLAAVPLTTTSGIETQPSFSPDGNKVAFAWNGEKEDNRDIYVKQIGSAGAPMRLTTSAAAEAYPAWSPDDRWIAFTRGQPDRGTVAIVLIPPLGGSERTLIEMMSVEGPCWTPDGKWLVFSAQESAAVGLSLWAIHVETGERRQLTSTLKRAGGAIGAEVPGDATPSVSPDGRTVAFARRQEAYVLALYALPLTPDLRPAGEPVRVTDQRYPMITGVAWTANGREIVYGAGGPRSRSLWRVSVSGGQAPTRLPYATPDATLPAIAARTSRLAYTWHLNNVNLWRLDTRTGERRMLIGSTYESRIPQYSPDGRKIASQSNRSGNVEVWTCDADGSNCLQLTSFGGPQCGTPRWSPDGRWLALDSRVEGQSEIYVIAADGGTPRRVTNGAGYGNTHPSWSADGGWIYFASGRSGRQEVWKVPAGGGQMVQVTRAGGMAALTIPGGTHLYYVKGPAQPGVFRMPVEGGDEEQVLARVSSWASFGVAATGVYFELDGRLQFLDGATGKVSTLTVVNNATGGLCVSPDGRYVVWAQRDRSTTDLMLVENFR